MILFKKSKNRHVYLFEINMLPPLNCTCHVRLCYNNLGAFATLNHLHFQDYYLGVPFSIEKAPTRNINDVNNNGNGEVVISEILNYPVRGVVHEGGRGTLKIFLIRFNPN